MKKQYVQGLTLPPELAAEQEQKQQMQAQIAGMRNAMALELYSRLVADYVNFHYINELDLNSLETDIKESRITYLANIAAYALTAAMVFMETAGMIRRENNSSSLQS